MPRPESRAVGVDIGLRLGEHGPVVDRAFRGRLVGLRDQRLKTFVALRLQQHDRLPIRRDDDDQLVAERGRDVARPAQILLRELRADRVHELGARIGEQAEEAVGVLPLLRPTRP